MPIENMVVILADDPFLYWVWVFYEGIQLFALVLFLFFYFELLLLCLHHQSQLGLVWGLLGKLACLLGSNFGLLDRKGLLYTGGGIHVCSPGTKSGQKK